MFEDNNDDADYKITPEQAGIIMEGVTPDVEVTEFRTGKRSITPIERMELRPEIVPQRDELGLLGYLPRETFVNFLRYVPPTELAALTTLSKYVGYLIMAEIDVLGSKLNNSWVGRLHEADHPLLYLEEYKREDFEGYIEECLYGHRSMPADNQILPQRCLLNPSSDDSIERLTEHFRFVNH